MLQLFQFFCCSFHCHLQFNWMYNCFRTKTDYIILIPILPFLPGIHMSTVFKLGLPTKQISRIRNPSVSQIEIWTGGQIPVWINKYLKNQFIGLPFQADCNLLDVSSTFCQIYSWSKSETLLISNTFRRQRCQVEFCIKCCKAEPPEAEQAVFPDVHRLALTSGRLTCGSS